MPRLDLRRLIVGLSVLSLAMALAVVLYASSVSQRSILAANALDDNLAYARRMAKAADDFLHDAMRGLAYGAKVLGTRVSEAQAAEAEVERLHRQSSAFDAVAYVDADGRLRAVTPDVPGGVGKVGSTLRSAPMLRALDARQPFITAPFTSAAGRWLILLVQPVYAAQDAYAGFVAGAIFLHESDALENLLGGVDAHSGGYQYVVDHDGVIIYHPNRLRIGERPVENPVVQSIMQGREGAMRLSNTEGVDMLAGYAIIQQTGWGVVVQRPADPELFSSAALMTRTVELSLLWLAVVLVCVGWLASRIARPLSHLAEAAVDLDKPIAGDRIQLVHAWYREARQIKNALSAERKKIGSRLDQLRQDSLTDSLTGLLNRRGLDGFLATADHDGLPMAVLVIDIDHFKNVNDRYGHAVGDEAIRRVAALLRSGARTKDVLARLGGEEFAMLLPHVGQEQALRIAERVRVEVRGHDIGPAEHCTISVGVACRPDHGAHMGDVLRRADEALYEAKRTGRDRVCVARAS